jgi:hypothetical protein
MCVWQEAVGPLRAEQVRAGNNFSRATGRQDVKLLPLFRVVHRN